MFECNPCGICTIAVAEQLRLGDYLAEEDFVVDATVDFAPIHCPMTTRRPV